MMQNLSIPDTRNSPPIDRLDSLDDWSQSTQEVIDTVPQQWSRGLLYLMVTFGVVVVPWSMVSQVDEVGTAQGRLEPKGKTVRLDAPVSGTVANVKLREGQTVKAGDRLLELNSETVRSELQQAQAKLEGLLNRLTQLIAIKSQLEMTTRTQRQQRQTQALEQQAQINQIRQRIDFYRSSSMLTQSLVVKDQNKAERFRQFRQMGIIPGIQVEEAERAAIESQQRWQQSQSEIVQARSELEKQRNTYEKILRDTDLAIIDSERQRKELQAQTVDLQAEILQTRNQIQSLQYQWKQRVMYIPVEGTIFQMSIQHPGAVVQPGQLVAQVAPKGAPLVLRAQMESGQSGFLKPGLPVKVKFDAYPYQDYGIVQGHVRWVSPDSKVVQNGQSQREVFDVEIELDRPYIQAGNQQIRLTPGQTATAEVIIRQRRVSELLLDPFRKLQKNGMNL